MTDTDTGKLNLDDYRLAPEGEGPLAATWADKPHRLVYDLCATIAALQARVDEAEKIADQLRDEAVQCILDTPPDETIARAVAEYGSAEAAVQATEDTGRIIDRARAKAAEAARAALEVENAGLQEALGLLSPQLREAVQPKGGR